MRPIEFLNIDDSLKERLLQAGIQYAEYLIAYDYSVDNLNLTYAQVQSVRDAAMLNIDATKIPVCIHYEINDKFDNLTPGVHYYCEFEQGYNERHADELNALIFELLDFKLNAYEAEIPAGLKSGRLNQYSDLRVKSLSNEQTAELCNRGINPIVCKRGFSSPIIWGASFVNLDNQVDAIIDREHRCVSHSFWKMAQHYEAVTHKSNVASLKNVTQLLIAKLKKHIDGKYDYNSVKETESDVSIKQQAKNILTGLIEVL